MRPQRVVRRRRVPGSPPRRSVARRGEGLPGYGAVLCVRALVEHPAGYGPLLAHLTEKLVWRGRLRDAVPGVSARKRTQGKGSGRSTMAAWRSTPAGRECVPGAVVSSGGARC